MQSSLRGVNVGGINIKMADLKFAAAALPVTGVKTVLAYGNVTCSSDLSAAELKSAFEAMLRERFGYDAWVAILAAGRLQEIVEACPYPPDNPDVHSYLTFGSDDGILAQLLALGADAGAEAVGLGPEAFAWPVQMGGTLDNPVSRLGAKARFNSSTTTRNLRTLEKVLAAAR
jgi:uncharacterized protein (DUF1697 family)